MPIVEVPQFINLEATIIGPLTLRQFLFLAAGGLLIFFLNYILETWLWFLVSIIIAIASVSLAFLKINEQPFSKVFINALRFYLNPRLYIRQRKPIERKLIEEQKKIVSKPTVKKRFTPEELEEIARRIEKKDKQL